MIEDNQEKMEAEKRAAKTIGRHELHFLRTRPPKVELTLSWRLLKSGQRTFVRNSMRRWKKQLQLHKSFNTLARDLREEIPDTKKDLHEEFHSQKSHGVSSKYS
jgi:hypothetical protein